MHKWGGFTFWAVSAEKSWTDCADGAISSSTGRTSSFPPGPTLTWDERHDRERTSPPKE